MSFSSSQLRAFHGFSFCFSAFMCQATNGCEISYAQQILIFPSQQPAERLQVRLPLDLFLSVVFSVVLVSQVQLGYLCLSDREVIIFNSPWNQTSHIAWRFPIHMISCVSSPEEPPLPIFNSEKARADAAAKKSKEKESQAKAKARGKIKGKHFLLDLFSFQIHFDSGLRRHFETEVRKCQRGIEEEKKALSYLFFYAHVCDAPCLALLFSLADSCYSIFLLPSSLLLLFLLLLSVSSFPSSCGAVSR